MHTETTYGNWQRAIVVLSYTFIAVVTIASLYWAQVVFIPIALAMFLTLILAPLVSLLQRTRMPRAAAVVLTVALSSCLIAGIGWIVTRQFVRLAGELPAYRENVRAKIHGVREFATSSTGRLGRFVDEMTAEFQRPSGDEPAPDDPSASSSEPELQKAASAVVAAARAPTIVIQPHTPPWLGQLTAALGSLGELLASFALAVVLTIFMLINREQLRDRLIRLIGDGRLTATTRAVDEAVHRISRFLLMQMVVNGTYGLALAVGLLLLGVEYAFLWGLVAAVLRYIPYLGAWIAAVPPVLLAVVMYPGWTQPLLVIGWIVLIELISNNFVEPLLYGQSMGVSEVALLVAAAFWTFLWGPIGLVLSSPLTVCLVVMGKYVPGLKFLDILLGDQPALEPEITFYQRLLAHDKTEATEIALAQARKLPIADVYDALLVPALSFFKRDRDHGELSDDDEAFIVQAIEEIIAELAETKADETADTARDIGSSGEARGTERVRLFACAAPDEADSLSLEMLNRLVDPARWEVHIAGIDTLVAEAVSLAAEQQAAIVCIASLPPGGLPQTRYLCKRLRASLPELKIVVGRWGMSADAKGTIQQLRDAGADEVERSLSDASRHLAEWWPAIAHRQQTASANVTVGESSVPASASA